MIGYMYCIELWTLPWYRACLMIQSYGGGCVGIYTGLYGGDRVAFSGGDKAACRGGCVAEGWRLSFGGVVQPTHGDAHGYNVKNNNAMCYPVWYNTLLYKS